MTARVALSCARVLALCALRAGLCMALTGAAAAGEKKLDLTADLTLASKYMVDGFKVGGDNPVWQPSVQLRHRPTGLSAMFWSALQVNRLNKQYDELDLFARYSHEFFTGRAHALELHGFYDYWFYPRNGVAYDELGNPIELPKRHGNKLSAGFSLPELLPLAGSSVVPSYNAYYWLYWAQNRKDQFRGGTHHELVLRYAHAIPRFIPGARAQYAALSGTANYHDGAFGVQPAWSHTTAHLTAGVYALGGLFAASLNRQWSHQASVDPSDELWSTLSFNKEI